MISSIAAKRALMFSACSSSGGKVLMLVGELSQAVERPHDVDAGLDRHGASQDRGEHDSAVLGEGQRQGPRVAMLLRFPPASFGLEADPSPRPDGRLHDFVDCSEQGLDVLRVVVETRVRTCGLILELAL